MTSLEGEVYLRRLAIFLDVVYALIFFEMLQYLPPAEDMKWVGNAGTPATAG